MPDYSPSWKAFAVNLIKEELKFYTDELDDEDISLAATALQAWSLLIDVPLPKYSFEPSFPAYLFLGDPNGGFYLAPFSVRCATIEQWSNVQSERFESRMKAVS
jgi:hypothetical protein